MIGIVGGVGPLAGVDLFRKIIEETKATADQEHLPVILWSTPQHIPDRTEYLEGRAAKNPAVPISKIFRELEKLGATVAAIPCNTAHAPQILEEVYRLMKEADSNLQILSIIEETTRYLLQNYAEGAAVGVLSTIGTRKRRIYAAPLEKAGFSVLAPETEEEQHAVHQAIYHKSYGIKATGTVVAQEAKEILYGAAQKLIDRGAKAVILGCTEIPLAIKEPFYNSTEMVDTVRILARALIKAYAPDQLKPI